MATQQATTTRDLGDRRRIERRYNHRLVDLTLPEFRRMLVTTLLFVIVAVLFLWMVRTVIIATILADQELLVHIRRAHLRHRGAYGAVKTWKHLNAEGICAGKHRVARLRREAGIEAKRKQRFRVSVEHHKTAEASPDLLNRQFSASAPDQVWVGDMTFVRTRQGWLHLAMLMDVYSRRVVGWAMGDKPNAELHDAALQMAVYQRRPAAGLIHHTDRGVMYRTTSYRAMLEAAAIRQSMSGRKSAYDNAMAESFFSNLKNELVHHSDFTTREQARCAIFEYIEAFYNRQRMHQALDYRSPLQIEAMYKAS